MITSGIIYLASITLGLILAVFPNSNGLPAEFETAVTTIASYVGILDPLVPITTLASAFAIVLLFEATIFAFRGIVWIYARVPFLGK